MLPYMFTIHISHVLPYTFDRFQVEATSIGARNCATIHVLLYMFHMFYHTHLTDFRLELQVMEQGTVLLYMLYRTCFTLPYMFYHTHFICSTVHVLLYTFSEIADRNCNYEGVKLPSGCVVPGSWSVHTFGCCFANHARLVCHGF